MYELNDNLLTIQQYLEITKDIYNIMYDKLTNNTAIIFKTILFNEDMITELSFELLYENISYDELVFILTNFLSLKDDLNKNSIGFEATHLVFEYTTDIVQYHNLINNNPEVTDTINIDTINNIKWKEYTFSMEILETLLNESKDNIIEIAMNKFINIIKDEIKDKVLWIKDFKYRLKSGEVKLVEHVNTDEIKTHLIITYVVLTEEEYNNLETYNTNNTNNSNSNNKSSDSSPFGPNGGRKGLHTTASLNKKHKGVNIVWYEDHLGLILIASNPVQHFTGIHSKKIEARWLC